jgi:DNA-directed RNA polymerase I subunit RPA1
MMGKRVDFACRSVISPDPYVGTNEIGIPLVFAKKLTYPVPVSLHNVEEMRKLIIRGPDNYPGAVWVEEGGGKNSMTGGSILRYDLLKMNEFRREALAARLVSEDGQMRVGRQLQTGDMMLMNRQVRNKVLKHNPMYHPPPLQKSHTTNVT